MNTASSQKLFEDLFFAKTEDELDQVLNKYPDVFLNPKNWFQLGGDALSNYGVIENQQSSSIAALIEKITNSIDAILMKKCLEIGVDPESNKAPKTLHDAVKIFFPSSSNWDLSSHKKQQAEDLQIIADGPRMKSSLVIYDNGEGQHPDRFEQTFLSLLKGNKNKIPFVQGKYNMGGTGAIVFCGKKRYQLIGSKRFDGTGNFGFTLIRIHPRTQEEKSSFKNTWYEFLKIEGVIPSFSIDQLDLGLYNRQFKTGSIIKLYSYDLPEGSRSVISRDLNQSINEYLFEPALPVYTIDNKVRYPDDRNLERELFGLKRRLEQDDSKYVDKVFSLELSDKLFGQMKVNCYVFKTKVEGKTAKESIATIRREFFKNGMSVLFSMNGQVHGHYTSEFITRTLKLNLLKDVLMIHVDCTNMDSDFRNQLFMASRDRLKNGEESRALREYLGNQLRKSELEEINKRRKESIGLESEDTTELIKQFAKNLPKNSELLKLLSNTLKLEEKKDKPKDSQEKKKISKPESKSFNPQRYPTYFKYLGKKDDGISVVSLPVGGEKTIRFETDAENQYFDRTDDPGELEIALVTPRTNTTEGGDQPGAGEQLGKTINVAKSSPINGIIKIALSPTEDLKVGDELQIKVTLDGTAGAFDELLLVKISNPEAPKEKTKTEEEDNSEAIGLPLLQKVKQEDWEKLEDIGISMNYETVMSTVGEGDKLEKVIINMDSQVLLNHKSKLKNASEEQLVTSERKYVASVYFHTIFLYMITKRKNYKISLTKEGKEEDIDVSSYIKDVFDSYYSDFLLNFGMEELMQGLSD